MGAGQADPELGWEPSSTPGWVAPHVAAEFPGLGISWIEVDGRPGRSPEPVERRLAETSNRFYGAHAIHMRERPIPWAYRVFFRQIGLDPDRTRTPVEQLALDRLQDGGFKTPRPAGGRADDRHGGDRDRPAGLRRRPARRCALHPRLRPGRVAGGPAGGALPRHPGDRRRRAPSGLLFGATGEGHEVSRRTRRIAIAAIQVDGVPQIAVDEALWMVAATLEAA